MKLILCDTQDSGVRPIGHFLWQGTMPGCHLFSALCPHRLPWRARWGHGLQLFAGASASPFRLAFPGYGPGHGRHSASPSRRGTDTPLLRDSLFWDSPGDHRLTLGPFRTVTAATWPRGQYPASKPSYSLSKPPPGKFNNIPVSGATPEGTTRDYTGDANGDVHRLSSGWKFKVKYIIQ